MAKLADLLLYKKRLDISHPDKPEKKLATVWVKLLGDEDLQAAMRAGRIASAARRAAFRDKTSELYLDVIAQLQEQPREVWEELVLSSEENKFSNQATMAIDREELPEMDSIAVNPDAPTLEEQERYDEEVDKVNNKYKEGIENYIKERLDVVREELKERTDDEVFQAAINAMGEIQPLQVYVAEITVQRAWRSVWDDEACKKRAFNNAEEFRNAHPYIKQVVLEAYETLDIGPEELKN